MGYTALREDERFNYGQYVEWDPRERWELIEGKPFAMSPAPASRHQRLLGRIFAQLSNQLEGRVCEAIPSPVDVRIPDADEADDEIMTVVQPDIVVVCDPKKIDEKGIRGAPDFVIEILSPRTELRDKTEKADLYERAGVREYWIVDPAAREVVVLRLADSGKWAAPSRYSPPARLEAAALPGLSIELEPVFEGL